MGYPVQDCTTRLIQDYTTRLSSTMLQISPSLNGEGKLKIHENLAYRAVNLVMVPCNLIKGIANIAKGLLFGLLALVFFGQSQILNKLTKDSFTDTGSAFAKTLINLGGIFAPNWALLETATNHGRHLFQFNHIFV